MGQDESSMVPASEPPVTLSDRSLEAVADYISSGKAKRIVVLTGAGISTAAGIPDFRSPKTGLYHNLARLNLPYAEAVFDISYFRTNPAPFYLLAKELYPGKFHPTVSHAFIALLARRNLLLRLFTQNIDCLERAAGVPSHLIVEAHGSFATQRCIECGEAYPDEDMRAHVSAGQVPHCTSTSESGSESESHRDASGCKGLVKPDIVFFGEGLPREFGQESHKVVMADLVLVLGTSLSVHPFAQLPGMAREGVPRVLINLERVGGMGGRADDVLELGECDEGVRRLAGLLGWGAELEEVWREVVGGEEAERQVRGRREREEEVEEEVGRLADEMAVLLKEVTEEVTEEKTEAKTEVKTEVEVKLEVRTEKEPEEAHQQDNAESKEPDTQKEGQQGQESQEETAVQPPEKSDT